MEAGPVAPEGLNRTSVGLKGSCIAPTPSGRLPPQSNQRGIERLGDLPVRERGRGLNRTSVGLKAGHGGTAEPNLTRLNRTSVGLKGRNVKEFLGCLTCLNRTSVGLKDLISRETLAYGAGLNRTSVGLKGRSRSSEPASRPEPQSNQRGIERMGRWSAPSRSPSGLNRTSVGLKAPGPAGRRTCRSEGLNRTSVGLKESHRNLCTTPRPPPQSNQRGIERGSGTAEATGPPAASIEPAWD